MVERCRRPQGSILGVHDDLSCTCTCVWSSFMPTMHLGRQNRRTGKGHGEQGRGMGAWHSRQRERPADLRNTDACVPCSALRNAVIIITNGGLCVFSPWTVLRAAAYTAETHARGRAHHPRWQIRRGETASRGSQTSTTARSRCTVSRGLVDKQAAASVLLTQSGSTPSGLRSSRRL